MTKLTNIKWNHYLNYIVVAAVTLLFAVLSLTGFLESSDKYLLEKIAIAITLAVSLSMVVGFLGELSLGHAGFMCIGAYLGGKTAVILEPVLGEWPALIVSLVVGGLVAAGFGMIIGLPALRLRGDYLAIVTLAFGEIVRSVFMNSSKESFGGSLGLDTPRFDKDILFVIAFVMVLACLAVTQNLIRSKHGRAITAIRDNEIAARATGIDVTKYKLLVFTVSSFFAGIAGVLYSYSNFTVQSTKFSYNYSIEILVMVVLGGMGNINGSIIAAALITFLDVELQTILTGNLAVLQDLIYALILIVLVIYNNAPALKSFRDKHNIKTFINRFKPHNPSKHRDDEAKWDRVPTKIKMDEVLSVDLQVSSPYTPDKAGKEDE
ncbi:MAG: branched-chain amino acid ABC transporter permease [Oscillospiraceae bacterium]|nr:branched-chain amino acid ABC transporter permease [Oscillospiraceae bacterium]MBQ2862243.1 branched-chain amino acid ABC transporter permease [Oscillospiraceae bacterium]